MPKLKHAKIQQVVNNKSNINQQPNPMLQKALEFVKGKEQHFISFCNRYNIDYQKENKKHKEDKISMTSFIRLISLTELIN